MQRLYPNVVWRKDKTQKKVYLTFDDGPIPECTPQILDILDRYGVQATFFMVAENAARYPHILERVRNQRHSVGNHTYHHIKGYKHSTQTYLQDIVNAEHVLQTSLFRPPHGRMTAQQKKALLEQGYTICLWDVLTHDYNPRYTVEHMMKVIKRYTRNGSIITCHDSLKSKDRILTLLPQMIEYLQEQGYEFATL
jgi:peptidoglycan/xylan/chitin deacetylase (PgdA/CDA1 family)